MTDDPRAAQLQDQLLRERARAHDAMNALQARIAELEGEVRDFRIAADTATREATEMRREMLQLRNQPAERHAQTERERELEQELESRRVAGINERMAAERLTETVRLLEHELLLLGTDTAATTALQRVGVIDRETAQALTGAPVAGDGPFATFAHVHDGQAIRLLVDLAPDVDESSPRRGTVPVDKFAKLTALEERLEAQEQRSLAKIRELSAELRTAAERLRHYENAEFAQTGTDGVPEADPEEKNPDGFYWIGQVGTDVEFILSDTAEIPRLETVEHTGRGGFVNTDYGMTLAGIDGSIHPVYGEFRDGYLFRVVIDMTSDFRRNGLLPE